MFPKDTLLEEIAINREEIPIDLESNQDSIDWTNSKKLTNHTNSPTKDGPTKVTDQVKYIYKKF